MESEERLSEKFGCAFSEWVLHVGDYSRKHAVAHCDRTEQSKLDSHLSKNFTHTLLSWSVLASLSAGDSCGWRSLPGTLTGCCLAATSTSVAKDELPRWLGSLTRGSLMTVPWVMLRWMTGTRGSGAGWRWSPGRGAGPPGLSWGCPGEGPGGPR